MRKQILLFIGILFLCASTSKMIAKPVPRGDSVQVILAQLAGIESNFKIVEFLPQTKRYHLVMPHDEVPENLVESLQNAFVYDIEMYCKYYAWKYLIDWRLLASKAARETFWGTSFLCNQAHNYFGIRARKKEWACASFSYCEGILKDDPQPSEFIVFPDFEASLWMFIHTIYNRYYLERLVDEGAKVKDAIQFERAKGVHYWQYADNKLFSNQLQGDIYKPEEIIYTWSGHPVNNLCVNCSRESDLLWIGKIDRIVERSSFE